MSDQEKETKNEKNTDKKKEQEQDVRRAQDQTNMQQQVQGSQVPMNRQQNGYYGYSNPYQNNPQNRGYYENFYGQGNTGNGNAGNGNTGNGYYNGMGSGSGSYNGMGAGNGSYNGMGAGNGFYNGAGGNGGKKKGGTGKKILLAACLGLFFGLCAGGAFLLVKELGNPAEEPVATEAIAEAETPETKENETEEPKADEESTEETPPVNGNLTDVSDIVEEIMPSVVSVNGLYTYTDDYWGETYSEKYDGGGSGFIIGQNETELLLATNAHVVSGVENMEVTFVDGAVADAITKGYDNDLDVAVIAVKLEDISEETKNAIETARLGDSTTLKAGQAVISIGNALLLGQSVTTGVVSAVNMPVGGGYDEMGNQYGADDRVMIQTTAFMNPGCSGGVLINASGEVVGINTMAISSEMVEGMCYAIPISDAIPVLNRLKEKEIRERLSEDDSGYLGISCTNVGRVQTEEYGIPAGVYVSEVYEDSVAETAGLQKGDVIVALEGDPLKTVNELEEMLRYYPVGEKIELEIMRYEKGDYKSRIIEVRLGKRPN